MTKKCVVSALALVLVGAAGLALAWHPFKHPEVGSTIEALDQGRVAYLTGQKEKGHAMAAPGPVATPADSATDTLGRHPVYPTGFRNEP